MLRTAPLCLYTWLVLDRTVPRWCATLRTSPDNALCQLPKVVGTERFTGKRISRLIPWVTSVELGYQTACLPLPLRQSWGAKVLHKNASLSSPGYESGIFQGLLVK